MAEGQKLNPEALKIALELNELESAAEFAAMLAIKHITMRSELRNMLKEKATEMRAIARKGEEEIEKLREKGFKKVTELEKQHDDLFDRLRLAQSELQGYEFRVDLEEGMYFIEGPIQEKQDEESKEEKEEDHVELDIDQVLKEVLSRFQKK
jgi:hypothetical protein